MYHVIVKAIAKRNFERVNRRDFDALLQDCVPHIHHRFGGHYALGGERHDREALRRWFERLGRLGRHLKITVNGVWVKGLPHNTLIIIRWAASDRFPDGSLYRNRGVHLVRMRWGKIVEIDVHEDSEAVANMLKKQAAAGVEEATAPQIVS